MIKVTTLHDNQFIINADLIELIEKTPDTIITLTTGKKIIVKESLDEVLQKVIEYRQQTRQVDVKRNTDEEMSA